MCRLSFVQPMRSVGVQIVICATNELCRRADCHLCDQLAHFLTQGLLDFLIQACWLMPLHDHCHFRCFMLCLVMMRDMVCFIGEFCGDAIVD